MQSQNRYITNKNYVLHYNKDYQSQAMKDGLENEQLVIDKYTEMMHQQGHTRVQVAKCGLFC